MATGNQQKQVIHIHILEHRTTDLLVAVSDDLYGLVVHGRSEEEIRDRLPGVIRELIEAQGHQLLSLDVKQDDRLARAGFGLPAYVASAALVDQRRDA